MTSVGGHGIQRSNVVGSSQCEWPPQVVGAWREGRPRGRPRTTVATPGGGAVSDSDRFFRALATRQVMIKVENVRLLGLAIGPLFWL